MEDRGASPSCWPRGSIEHWRSPPWCCESTARTHPAAHRWPFAIFVASGRPRRRHIATIPTAGPRASSQNARRHVSLSVGSRRPIPRIVTPVRTKPAASWSDERRAGGPSRRELRDRGRELGGVGDDGQAPDEADERHDDRVRPEQEARPRSLTGQLAAIAAIVSVVRPSRSARAPATAQPIPPIATTANDAKLAPAGSSAPAAANDAAMNSGQPRPHRVELPHVPEVPEIGQPDGRLPERRRGDARAEPRRRWLERPGPGGHRDEERRRRPRPRWPQRRSRASRRRPSRRAARIRWGRADPTVSAPIRTPIARPRSRRNQPASIFSAIG